MEIIIDKDNYKYLDEKIENNLIERYLNIKTIEKDGEVSIFKTISLTKLESLNFDDEEIYYVMDYLKEKNIYVVGFSKATYTIFDNFIDIHSKSSQNKKYQIDLDEKTQIQLLKSYRNTRNLEVRNTLILAYLKLVNRNAASFSNAFNFDVEELESYGYEGLIMALENYDFNKSKLASYINNNIRYSILNGICNEYQMSSKENFKKLRDISVKLKKLYDYDDTYSEYNYHDEIIKEFVDENSSYNVRYRDMQTINLLYSDSLDEHEDDIAASDDNSLYNEVIEKIYQEELNKDVAKAIRKIPVRDKYIMIKRYGLDGEEQENLEEVAKVLGISSQSISMHQRHALRYLKDHCGKLEEHLNEGYDFHEYDYDSTGIKYQKVRGNKNGR